MIIPKIIGILFLSLSMLYAFVSIYLAFNKPDIY